MEIIIYRRRFTRWGVDGTLVIKGTKVCNTIEHPEHYLPAGDYEIAKEKQVILPLHPRTKNILDNLKLNIQNLTLIHPVGYLEMVWLINNCDFVMTDSGGLQKEAYFFEKQCITLRDETEWIELVECGANTLVGADKNKIIEAYRNNSEFNKQNSKLDLYGGGRASENIVKELLKY
jgi:UDP-GlcNAc3NAcA epimerase